MIGLLQLHTQQLLVEDRDAWLHKNEARCVEDTRNDGYDRNSPDEAT